MTFPIYPHESSPASDERRAGILLHPTRPRWSLVNGTALDITRQLDAGTSIEAVASGLVSQYGIDHATALRDVEATHEELIQREMIGEETLLPVRIPRLESLFLHLTTCCNLSCSHCYVAGPVAGDLPLDAVKRLIDDLVAQGGRQVTFSGGEPLLYPAIREALAHVGQRLKVSLLTNGTLLSAEWAQFLAREVDASVQISLDGSCPEIHEAIRGKGSFAGALSAVEALQRAGLGHKTAIATTITQRNIHDLHNIIELAKSMGVPRVRFLPVRPAGRAEEHWPEVGEHLRRESYEVFFDQLLAPGMHKDFPGIDVSCGLSGLFLQEPEEDPGDGMWCPVGKKLVVAVNGDVFPCALIMQEAFRMGNIFHNTIEDMMASRAMRDMCATLGERRTRIEKCSSCLWRNFCQGGCMGHALDFKGTLWATDQFCSYRDRSYRRIFDGFLADFDPNRTM